MQTWNYCPHCSGYLDRNRKCGKYHRRTSDRYESFFDVTPRTECRKIYSILQEWTLKHSIEDACKKEAVCERTVSSIYHRADMIASKIVNKAKFDPRGIVEIDESLVAKRKYNKGRCTKYMQCWTFGAYQRPNDKLGIKRALKCRLVLRRDERTLLPKIKQWCHPG